MPNQTSMPQFPVEDLHPSRPKASVLKRPQTMAFAGVIVAGLTAMGAYNWLSKDDPENRTAAASVIHGLGGIKLNADYGKLPDVPPPTEKPIKAEPPPPAPPAPPPEPRDRTILGMVTAYPNPSEAAARAEVDRWMLAAAGGSPPIPQASGTGQIPSGQMPPEAAPATPPRGVLGNGYGQQANADDRSQSYWSRIQNGRQNFIDQRRGGGANLYHHDQKTYGNLPGCVVKAGTRIPLENLYDIRTEIPGEADLQVSENVLGYNFQRRQNCLAIPSGSRVSVAFDSQNIGRGDSRISMCAHRLDLPNGIKNLGCFQAHGPEGATGVPGDADWNVGGVLGGILIESVFGLASNLAGLLMGPPGVFVSIGANTARRYAGEYTDQYLLRPPILTVKRSAQLQLRVSADLSF